MIRARTLFTSVIPSLLVGGMVLGSGLGHASAGRDEVGFWPTDPNIPPAPPAPPSPPAPAVPAAPRPPTPPIPPVVAPSASASVDVERLRDSITDQLDEARESIRNNPAIPKQVRERVLEHLAKARNEVRERLSRLKHVDPAKLSGEMGKMGEEIQRAMQGLGGDMSRLGTDEAEKWAQKWSKQFKLNGDDWAKSFKWPKDAKGWQQLKLDPGDDDDNDDDDDAGDLPMAPDVDVDVDDDDLKDAVRDLKGLALKPAQREAISKLSHDSDQSVKTSRKTLDELSTKLHDALGNPATSDAEIGRYIDQISAQEAAIRKARILAWVNARRVLDAAQRKKIEDAAKKPSK